MRDAMSKTMIPALILASLMGLAACGGGDGDATGAEGNASSAEVVASERASQAQDPAVETGSAHSTAAPDAAVDQPLVLAQGAEVEVVDHLDAGKITIIDFYSEYCGPCRRIEPYLLRLHQEREDITVVKVDINRPGVRGIDWGSPVAKQYGLQSIPHFRIYDPEGRLLAEGREAIGLLQGYMEGKS